MDVPSKKEFEELQAKIDGLYRHLGLQATPCWHHRQFQAKVKRAINNCDVVTSYTCEDCGADYGVSTSVVVTKIQP